MRVWAHPRVGGENRPGEYLSVIDVGSSPRGRGKRGVGQHEHGGNRLIPAWAGKTTYPRTRCWNRPAHPRVGGENPPSSKRPTGNWGSSPRGRGKPWPAYGDAITQRLIPAWAGKTCCVHPTASAAAAHPRVGGENTAPTRTKRERGGSSPRGRGKLLLLFRLDLQVGLIPAWAGKTR